MKQLSAVEPFPRLKPGEERRISVDTADADGADDSPMQMVWMVAFHLRG
jgi:hypothetical protein